MKKEEADATELRAFLVERHATSVKCFGCRLPEPLRKAIEAERRAGMPIPELVNFLVQKRGYQINEAQRLDHHFRAQHLRRLGLPPIDPMR